ncbi:MAG: hypothetical protein R3E48_23170 [Burkholderiaceae bacterium]
MLYLFDGIEAVRLFRGVSSHQPQWPSVALRGGTRCASRGNARLPGSAHQRFCLVDAFLLLTLRHGIVDDAGAVACTHHAVSTRAVRSTTHVHSPEAEK